MASVPQNFPARGVQFLRLLTLLLFLLPPGTTAQEDAALESHYRLAPGDVIEVRVYGEDDLSMRLSVPTGGGVDYAFVGRFDLAGKTASAVEQEIHDRLEGDYLVDPRVSVSVVSYRNIYVYGQVARPGSYAWEPGLTVRKVITLAGGLRERASGSKWFLVSEGGTEADRRRVDEDAAVNPGDTLTIGESFF